MKFKIFAVLAVLTFVLAACAPAATQAPAAPAEPAAPAATEAAPAAPAAEAKPVVVAVWSGPEHDNLVKVAEEYTKKTGKEVIVEEVAREAYFDKLNTITATCGKDYDAFYAMSDFVPVYVAAEGLKDLNTFFEDPAVASPDFSLKDYGLATDFSLTMVKPMHCPQKAIPPGCGTAKTSSKKPVLRPLKPGRISMPPPRS